MTYTSLMVNVIAGRSNARLLEVAVGLARTFDAGVRGIAACRPIHCLCHDYPVPASLFEEDRKQITRHLREGEHEFRAAMATIKGRIEWQARTCTEPLAEYLATEARSADLIVVGMDEDEVSETTRKPDTCDLVMQAGRPVLLVPTALPMAAFERVVVAWKDTREARRAIVDALPFLVKAAKVTVVAIAAVDAVDDARNSLSQIVAWLARHGIKAESTVRPSHQANASQLKSIASELGANLIVAGAYGYSRHGQWVLGGITSELFGGRLCALVSH